MANTTMILGRPVQQIMEECVRRAVTFHDGSLNVELLLPAYPSHVKPAVKAGLLRCTSALETPRVVHWYKLTSRGRLVAESMLADAKT